MKDRDHTNCSNKFGENRVMEAEQNSVSVCPHLTSSLSETGNLTSMKKTP